MVHAGTRGSFISLFIIVNPVAMMRRKEATNSRRVPLSFLVFLFVCFFKHKSQSELQAATTVTVTHEEI